MKNIQVIPVKYGSGAEILSLIEEDTLFIYSNNSWHEDENSIGLPISGYEEGLDRLLKILSEKDYRRIILEVADDDSDGSQLFGCDGIDRAVRRRITDSIRALDSSMSGTYGCKTSQEYLDCMDI